MLVPFLGSNFFPSVDAGQITLHVRAPVGTRIEDTAAMFDHIERAIRQVDPAATSSRRSSTTSACRPARINTVYNNSGVIGHQDGDIYVSLKPSITARRRTMCASCASRCRSRFPGTTFSFLPADIISQILNFGAPAPIDVQVAGPNIDKANQAYALELLRRMRAHPRRRRRAHAAVLPATRSSASTSTARASAQLGLTERDVTNSVVDLAGRQLADRADLLAQSADRRVLSDRRADAGIPGRQPGRACRTCRSTGAHRRPADPGRPRQDHAASNPSAVVSHYNIQPSIDLYATPQDRDLGGVAARHPRR